MRRRTGISAFRSCQDMSETNHIMRVLGRTFIIALAAFPAKIALEASGSGRVPGKLVQSPGREKWKVGVAFFVFCKMPPRDRPDPQASPEFCTEKTGCQHARTLPLESWVETFSPDTHQRLGALADVMLEDFTRLRGSLPLHGPVCFKTALLFLSC